jgi:hypothetical protein
MGDATERDAQEKKERAKKKQQEREEKKRKDEEEKKEKAEQRQKESEEKNKRKREEEEEVKEQKRQKVEKVKKRKEEMEAGGFWCYCWEENEQCQGELVQCSTKNTRYVRCPAQNWVCRKRAMAGAGMQTWEEIKQVEKWYCERCKSTSTGAA